MNPCVTLNQRKLFTKVCFALFSFLGSRHTKQLQVERHCYKNLSELCSNPSPNNKSVGDPRPLKEDTAAETEAEAAETAKHAEMVEHAEKAEHAEAAERADTAEHAEVAEMAEEADVVESAALEPENSSNFDSETVV